MASIRHSSDGHPGGTALPDLRNLGLLARVVLAANGLALAAALFVSPDWRGLAMELALVAARVEPPLLICLLLLYGLQPLLARLTRWPALAAVALCAAASSLLMGWLLPPLWEAFSWRQPFWAVLCALLLAHYFSLRRDALSPALAEARLMALTARIRPHFLFNSLNAVLGIMRENPRRAETALEELAELFRALMAENRELVPLSKEIALARQYLELERLRLGERLSVRWQVESCPPDALVPPLLLQPLLENAVHHGIEPAMEPGEIVVGFERRGDDVFIRMTNPWHGEGAHAGGNRLALSNVKERLMLFYDLEASLESGVKEGRYELQIRLPYRKGATA